MIKRSTRREALRGLIERAFSGITVEQVTARLDAAGIGYGQMNDMAALWAHPQLKARDRWREVESPNGPLTSLMPPGASSAFEPRLDAIPALGAHTEAILLEIGYSAEAIAKRRSGG